MHLTTISPNILCSRCGAAARARVGIGAGESMSLGVEAAAHYIGGALLIFTQAAHDELCVRRIDIHTGLVVGATAVDATCIAGQERERAAELADDVITALFDGDRRAA